MQIKVCPNEEANTYTLEIEGEIDISNSHSLGSYLRSPLNVTTIDLTKVPFIDSSGIGILVYYSRIKRERKEPLEILISPQIKNTLEICGFGLICNTRMVLDTEGAKQ